MGGQQIKESKVVKAEGPQQEEEGPGTGDPRERLQAKLFTGLCGKWEEEDSAR